MMMAKKVPMNAHASMGPGSGIRTSVIDVVSSIGICIPHDRVVRKGGNEAGTLPFGDGAQR